MTDLLHILLSDTPDKMESSVLEDIRKHLLYLLNSQREAVMHLPFYGLPDLSYLRTHLPYSEETLLNNIRKTLMNYEPRLQNLYVKKENNSLSDTFLLKIKIEAKSKTGDSLQYGGYISPTGELNIE